LAFRFNALVLSEPLEAARLLDLTLDQGNRDGQLVWRRIRRAIVELQAEPTGPVH